jgi:hypothetical protein
MTPYSAGELSIALFFFGPSLIVFVGIVTFRLTRLAWRLWRCRDDFRRAGEGY